MFFPEGWNSELVGNKAWEQIVLLCLLICKLIWRVGQQAWHEEYLQVYVSHKIVVLFLYRSNINTYMFQK